MAWWKIPLLRFDLHSRDPSRRLRAAAVLAARDDARGRRLLEEALRGESPEQRCRGYFALARVRKPWVPALLVRGLSDADSDVWMAAAEGLSLAGRAAVPLLEPILEGLGAPATGAETGTVPDPAGGIPRGELLERAVEVLDSLGWRPDSARQRVCAGFARRSVTQVAREGRAAVAVATGLLFCSDPELAGTARLALVEIGSQAVDDLLTELSRRPSQAGPLLDVLVVLREPRVAPALATLLAVDGVPFRVRCRAAEALREMQYRPADPTHRLAMRLCLGEWQAATGMPERAMPLLRQALQEAQVPWRLEVLATLPRLGPERGQELLLEGLANREWRVRAAALRTLAQLGPEMAPHLARALADPMIRRESRQALLQLGSAALRALADAWNDSGEPERALFLDAALQIAETDDSDGSGGLRCLAEAVYGAELLGAGDLQRKELLDLLRRARDAAAGRPTAGEGTP